MCSFVGWLVDCCWFVCFVLLARLFVCVFDGVVVCGVCVALCLSVGVWFACLLGLLFVCLRTLGDIGSFVCVVDGCVCLFRVYVDVWFERLFEWLVSCLFGCALAWLIAGSVTFLVGVFARSVRVVCVLFGWLRACLIG